MSPSRTGAHRREPERLWTVACVGGGLMQAADLFLDMVQVIGNLKIDVLEENK